MLHFDAVLMHLLSCFDFFVAFVMWWDFSTGMQADAVKLLSDSS